METAESNGFTYCLAVLSDYMLDEETFEELDEWFSNRTGKIAITSNVAREKYSKEELAILEKWNKGPYGEFHFLVIRVNVEDTKQAVEEYKKQHKWKKILGLLSEQDYLDVTVKAALNFENIIFSSADKQEVIRFLQSHKEEA